MEQQEAHRLRAEERERMQAALEALPPPYVTYALLAVIILIFGAMVWVGGQNGSIWATAANARTLFGDKDNALILAGQWWRFVTPIFLHGGLLHLAVNSYSLYRLGTQMEQFYGSRRYLMIFVVAGIAGNVASFWLNPLVHSVGASGALFGLIGAGLVFPWRYRALIPAEERNRIFRQLGQITLINLLIGFSRSDIIDNWAHIGGLIGGGFVALFLMPDALMSRPLRPAANAALWVGGALAVGLLVLAGVEQGAWALHLGGPQILPLQAAYPPDSTVPWWSVRVPQGWKLEGAVRLSAGTWRAPRGWTLEIRDSVHDPEVFLLAKQLADQPVSQVHHGLIDRKPARTFTQRSGDRTADIYLVDAFDRSFEIKLEADTQSYPQAQPTFQLILSSVRFIHPPTIEEDTAPPLATAP